MSLINIAPKGRIKAYFFGKYNAPNRAMAPIGAKFGMWGRNLQAIPRAMSSVGMINFFIVFVCLYLYNLR